MNLANVYESQGKYAKAEEFYQRSLKVLEKALGPDHPYVASVLNNLAVLYESEGRDADAEPLYQRSARIYERALGPKHPSLALSVYNLAMLCARHGRRAEALAYLRRALPGGMDQPWMRDIAKDEDLVSLHGDPEFEKIVAEVRARAKTQASDQK
jgi:tetratricopeptide (TPR) repeat protein